MTSEIWALIGVLFGFTLGEISQILRRHWSISRAKKNLKLELRTLLGIIPQKRHIIAQAREALHKNKIMPTSGIPISRIGYDIYFPAALPALNTVSRSCIHNIYERLILNDSFLDRYKDEIITAIREKIINNPYTEYAARFIEFDHSYVIAQDLINSYLEDKPIDVYPEIDVGDLLPPTAYPKHSADR
jgi:hypothetical protein